MTRLLITLAATAVALTDFAVPQVALAQSSQDSIAEVVVYGNDPCPRSSDDQVVVCARRPESERFRIPEKLRSSGNAQQTNSWANRAKVLETVGSTGTNTCSPVGPGGYTGCLTQVIKQAREERQQQNQQSTPQE